MRTPISVQAAYDAWAATYDSDVNSTRDLDAQVLRSVSLPLDNAVVIEFGAGTGKNTSYLASRARCVLCLDLSAEMLKRAR
jgi:trans-aconitate methyltransferase